ncbi:PREDICTED: acyl-CoA synthetase family member 3, mitochondrial [Drosophila arizonae]|uniref:Acyl-CoA synthetase family member 3, mitochondrial n=1 Tax=Drosophila arizonae TaxID=7263 RepID=A0ABM1PYS6_DROAR|nr:PREDICTED: acyl-CoA synthetase family member 3, mitochondrial [Drosophila arizonae]
MLSLRRLQRFQWRPLVRLCSAELVHKDTFIEKLRNSYIEDERNNFVVPTFKKAMLFPDEIAIKDLNGEFTYFQLYITAKKLAIQISNFCGSASQSNVAFLCSTNALWIVIQWGCWISGQVAVPLEPNQAADELLSQATDCKAKLLIGTPECENITQELATKLQTASIVLDHSFVPTPESVASTAMYAKQLVGLNGALIPESTLPNDYYANAPAMLIYTPSSSNSRNGVVLTHRNIEAQMRCLVSSWHLKATDSMLPLISMNRMHAAIGALLGVGGNILLQQKFDSHTAWSSLLGINSPSKQRVNIFLAMPIIYKRLIAEYDKMFAQDSRMVEYIINHCKQKIRLMATAFGLLPESVFYRWREITGQNIYEYYGMLETGLVLGPALDEQSPNSNADYRPGTLGAPLIGVTARLVNNQGDQLVSCKSESSMESNASSDEKTNSMPVLNTVVGELEIAGANLFPRKINTILQITPVKVGTTATVDQVAPMEQTAEKFLKTGDICAYRNGSFNFLSKSTDVFNVGGYKVYGSEIKKALISHPSINDVAVLGIPNKLWGHRLGVICILSPDADVDLETIKSYCYRQLPAHKRPTVFKTIVAK